MGEVEEGLRQLASGNANTCRVKAGEICGACTVALLAIDLISGEI